MMSTARLLYMLKTNSSNVNEAIREISNFFNKKQTSKQTAYERTKTNNVAFLCA